MGMPLGMVAGAVVSGAYFGDKLSPLSDTTNLAPAMAGTDLFTHIRYMTITTIPTMALTLIMFIVLGLMQDTTAITDDGATLAAIKETFYVTPWLFIVPIIVIVLIVKNRTSNSIISRNYIRWNFCIDFSTGFGGKDWRWFSSQFCKWI